MHRFEVLGWVAGNRGDHFLWDPSNERQQRECAPGNTTDTKDPMHGKRAFPWPRQLPELTLQRDLWQRFLRMSWGEQEPASASIH